MAYNKGPIASGPADFECERCHDRTPLDDLFYASALSSKTEGSITRLVTIEHRVCGSCYFAVNPKYDVRLLSVYEEALAVADAAWDAWQPEKQLPANTLTRPTDEVVTPDPSVPPSPFRPPFTPPPPMLPPFPFPF